MRRQIAPFAAAAVLALSLAGCATSDEPAASPNADLVSVTGDFGQAVTVDFPTPISVETTECRTDIAGTGDRIDDGQLIIASVTAFDAATGEQIQATAPQAFPVGKTNDGFDKALACASADSRVVAVVAGSELGQGDDAGGSFVVVFDVTQSFPARADGDPRPGRDGFPAVVLGPDGRPGITVPEAPAPKDVETSVLRQGSGDTFDEGQTAVFHQAIVNWDTNTLVSTTWEAGTPNAVLLDPASADATQKAITDAIVGQQVGSQLIVVIPTEDGSATVNVIDLLGVVG